MLSVMNEATLLTICRNVVTFIETRVPELKGRIAWKSELDAKDELAAAVDVVDSKDRPRFAARIAIVPLRGGDGRFEVSVSCGSVNSIGPVTVRGEDVTAEDPARYEGVLAELAVSLRHKTYASGWLPGP